MDLKFRIATMADAKLLFQWRNDPETRKQCHTTGNIYYDNHLSWLEKSLVNANREIRIVELNGVAVGHIRLDKAVDRYELTWSVAPNARGKGIGKSMLKATLATLTLPARAEIKSANAASKRMAVYAGMTLEREEKNVLYYHYSPLRA